MAVGRACRDAWSASLIQPLTTFDTWGGSACSTAPGETWAEIGARVGQRNISVTADRYTHAMLDYGEIDRQKLLQMCTDGAHPRCTPLVPKNGALAGEF